MPAAKPSEGAVVAHALNGKRVFVQAGEVGMVGGAAKATVLLCDALVELGARVTLFVTLMPSDDVRDELVQKGVVVVAAFVRGGWRYRLPQACLVMQIWIRALYQRPSLIHVVGISREAGQLLGLPSLAPVYVWETTEAQPGNKFVDAGAARSLHRARAVLVPSATIERNVRATYKYAGLISRLPFWCQDVPTQLERDSRTAPRASILFFGRMDPEKGLPDLVKAFTSVQKIVRGARLTLCGGGEVQQATGLSSLPVGIEFAGRVSSDDLDRLIRGADVVVLPSLHEGYPISLLEACARSVPIVATTVGSIPELFAGRTCALLVPPQNPQLLAEAIVDILTELPGVHDKRREDSRAVFEAVSSPAIVLSNLRRAYI